MTAIPVIAIVKKRRLFEDSFASLSAGLSFLHRKKNTSKWFTHKENKYQYTKLPF